MFNNIYFKCSIVLNQIWTHKNCLMTYLDPLIYTNLLGVVGKMGDFPLRMRMWRSKYSHVTQYFKILLHRLSLIPTSIQFKINVRLRLHILINYKQIKIKKLKIITTVFATYNLIYYSTLFRLNVNSYIYLDYCYSFTVPNFFIIHNLICLVCTI
jgi:hypothetical protein